MQGACSGSEDAFLPTGPQVAEGALQDVDPAVQDVVDLEFGLKAPTKRFGILVQQDLADPMPDILKTAGLDQDQFIRLLRQPGEQWRVWDIWETQANGGDGLFPTQAELEQLDGIVITGDSGSPSQAALATLRSLIVEQAAKGKRILGICGGMGAITRAYNGTYPSLLSMSNFDPFTSALPFGTANISFNAAAKQAINGSWARLLPDSILINHMPTEYVAVLPARAVQLGYSNWEGPPYSFVDLYAVGPYDNVLAIKGHPEATDGAVGRSITQAFLNHAADQIALGVRAGKMPGWASAWANQQIGRMLSSYRQYSNEDLMKSYQQFSNVLKAFLNGD
ncbi:glutamine amidotransferase isoform B [Chlorella sorokiniana]|uniref:Glutamine amidotransferase isoform B n=1 Tax=Chlorella sorokiniana TaxID=3076 RepID=A0A2P6TWE5_CHLSO|nr:glutamine amidotransferase isoform B [Chlorella sorokiniana]|eukprot:PRW58381.1 glutamine amidotransferase isoform B [Chlorella sorokiniana]